MRPKIDKNETEIETKDASLSLVNSLRKLVLIEGRGKGIIVWYINLR